MKRSLFTAYAAVLLAFPAFGNDTFEIPVDGKFFDASMRWNNATAGGYDAKMKLVLDKRGNLALCGIGRMTNVQLAQAIRKGLRGGRLVVNGKTVIKGFTYFTKARKAAELTSGVATCKSSGVKPPRSADRIDISYGDATFRN